ncbi:MAG: glycoside hydrolase family 127 protein, partial [Planctomycetaceae bacterium]|nr:glycoside hydrolase family 127 protein [Planctomycetaceae bacterium]
KFDVPGHEEIELALVKLYQLTGKEKYLTLSQHFIDIRGDQYKRNDKLHGQYQQDHLPIRDQSEIVGHAVRAVYLYVGVADNAAYSGDKELIDAMDRLWNNTVNKKMYITGGIGAIHKGEAFGKEYELPNASAYCETCAAIGLVFWAHRMNLLHGDAKYADVIERAIYNGILAGIGMDGKSFFYVNPLESNGNHHRQPFFDTACCPTNIVRFLPSLPGYQYAIDKDGIVVNQFIAGEANIKTPRADVSLKLKTRVGGYPWGGDLTFAGTVKRKDPNDKKPLIVKLRIPSWCHYPDEKPRIKLYRGKSSRTARGSINDKPEYDHIPYKIEKGYAVFRLPSEPDFEFTYDIPFTYRRIVANPQVAANRGRVALMLGPFVYCFEEIDNPDLNDRIMLKKDMQWHDDIQGTSTSDHNFATPEHILRIRVKTAAGDDLIAIPYFTWDFRNKPAGKMKIWIRQEGLLRNLDAESPLWKTPTGQPILYQPLPDDEHPYYPQDPRNKPENCLLRDDVVSETEREITASFCFPNDSTDAVIDGIEPKNSIDHTIPRLTFWNHKGTTEWLELNFGNKKKVSQCSVYWFDDTGKGGCRVPKSWTLSYLDNNNKWQPVKTTETFGVEKDKYNTVKFDEVETRGLRMDIQLQDGFSGGVLEWKTP